MNDIIDWEAIILVFMLWGNNDTQWAYDAIEDILQGMNPATLKMAGLLQGL